MWSNIKCKRAKHIMKFQLRADYRTVKSAQRWHEQNASAANRLNCTLLQSCREKQRVNIFIIIFFSIYFTFAIFTEWRLSSENVNSDTPTRGFACSKKKKKKKWNHFFLIVSFHIIFFFIRGSRQRWALNLSRRFVRKITVRHYMVCKIKWECRE